MNDRATQLLEEAKAYLASGEQKQMGADADKWAAAERMWKANKEEEARQVDIAAALGISQKTVSLYVALADGRYTGRYTGSFTEAYYELRENHTPEAREERAVDRVLRERPEVVAEKLAELPDAARAIADHPDARRTVGRAMDDHYADRVEKNAQRRRNDEAERKGGEENLAAHERRQRVAELIAVARGAASGLRFVAGQAKDLDLEEDDSGAAEELGELLDDIDGFVSMLRSFLAGSAITDDDLAALIQDDVA